MDIIQYVFTGVAIFIAFVVVTAAFFVFACIAGALTILSLHVVNKLHNKITGIETFDFEESEGVTRLIYTIILVSLWSCYFVLISMGVNALIKSIMGV